MNHFQKLLITAFLLTAGTTRANEVISAQDQGQALLLKGATVHTVSGAPVRGGQVLISGGKIKGVGQELEVPPKTEVIDLAGKHIYPGLIAANTVLGLTEVSAVRATRDVIEPGRINPNARAQVAVNPDSELLPVTRANGVLVVQVVPNASGRGAISGTGAVMALDGWTWEDMTVRADAGVHIAWPRMFVRPRNGSEDAKKEADKSRKQRDVRIKELERAFTNARAYLKARDASPDTTDTDLRWEAMRPLFSGDAPAFIEANTASEIRAALAFAKGQEIKKVAIVGGQDAWRVADELKALDASVIVSPVNESPLRRWEPVDTAQQNPLRLSEAGVTFCIANDGGTFSAAHERNLPYQAARSALPRDEAVRAITLYPAQILGVADQLGSIEPGKDATLIITDGNPLDIRTNVERAFIAGREIDLSTKQTRLYEKYRKKYGK